MKPNISMGTEQYRMKYVGVTQHLLIAFAGLILLMNMIGVAPAFASGQIIDFGVLPEGDSSVAYAISSNGAAVVGKAIDGSGGQHAYFWTETGGRLPMGTLGGLESCATAVSADGSVIVGWADNATGQSRAFRWTEDTGMVSLGVLAGGSTSAAAGVSADGSVIVGWADNATGQSRAFRWTEDTGMVSLGVLTGGSTAAAAGVSADGSVIVGWADNATGQSRAFRWTEDTGMVSLGVLAGGSTSAAAGVSADGSVIVGWADNATGQSRAFRWTEDTGMVSLGVLAGGSTSAAAGVSADGNIVTGSAEYSGSDRAFRWAASVEMQSVKEWLAACGIDTTGYEFASALGVSHKGGAVVGQLANNGHAYFAQGDPTLHVVKSGAGYGTVTSTPDGINCGSQCTLSFQTGTVVTLTALANTGSAFLDWAGCTPVGGGSCTVTMTSNITATAAFAITHTLTVNKGGAGAGTVNSDPLGISCDEGCISATHTFLGDQAITLTASTGATSAFNYWTGACEGTLPSCSITLSGDLTAGAVFVPSKTKRLVLTVSRAKVNKGDGTVQSYDRTINCSPSAKTCKNSYYKSTPIRLIASPVTNSAFGGWKPASLGCTGSSCTLTMNKARSVQAVFVGPPRLTVAKQKVNKGNGTVTSNPSGIDCGDVCKHNYLLHSTVTLTAAPDENSVFTGWKPASLGCAGSSCTGTIDKARSVQAVFVGPPRLTVAKQKVNKGNGTVTSNPSGIDCGDVCKHNYLLHSTVTLTAAPDENSVFTGWKPASLGCAGSSCTLTVDKAVGVTAVFTGTGN